MIGWFIGGRVHRENSTRKVAHSKKNPKKKPYGTCDSNEDANHVMSTLVQYNGTHKLKSMFF